MYYAVRIGRNPGVYATWNECKRQVDKFPNPVFRKFHTLQEAESFVKSLRPGAEEGNTLKRLRGSDEPAAGSLAKRVRTTQLIEAVPLAIPTPGSSTVVYTDGACAKNGRRGSKGGIGVYWGPDHHMNVSKPLEGRQTNNRAEIMAAVTAVEQAKGMGLKDVTVATDSMFLINGITNWIKKWKRNGWKTSSGADVINKEDFLALDDARQGIQVRFQHVRGHASCFGNNEADRLARGGVLD